MVLWTPPGADLGENAAPDPDTRMIHFGGGLDSNGQVLPMTYRRLRSYTDDTYVITKATPVGPARLLKASKDMFALGFYSYELVACAASWSIFAVEAALKLRVGAGRDLAFQKLVEKARAEGLVGEYLADILNTGRTVRNRFVHEGVQPNWTFGMASQVIGASFKIVAELYPDEGSTEQPSDRRETITLD